MPYGKMRGKKPRNYRTSTKSGLFGVNEQHIMQADNEWALGLGESVNAPASSADAIYTDNPAAQSGLLPHVWFGRNEPALHHYHNTFREALGMPLLDPVTATE